MVADPSGRAPGDLTFSGWWLSASAARRTLLPESLVAGAWRCDRCGAHLRERAVRLLRGADGIRRRGASRGDAPSTSTPETALGRSPVRAPYALKGGQLEPQRPSEACLTAAAVSVYAPTSSVARSKLLDRISEPPLPGEIRRTNDPELAARPRKDPPRARGLWLSRARGIDNQRDYARPPLVVDPRAGAWTVAVPPTASSQHARAGGSSGGRRLISRCAASRCCFAPCRAPTPARAGQATLTVRDTW